MWWSSISHYYSPVELQPPAGAVTAGCPASKRRPCLCKSPFRKLGDKNTILAHNISRNVNCDVALLHRLKEPVEIKLNHYVFTRKAVNTRIMVLLSVTVSILLWSTTMTDWACGLATNVGQFLNWYDLQLLVQNAASAAICSGKRYHHSLTDYHIY